jgi:heme/copper-type cytochrome/quinol oxidase subunit 4
LRELINQRATYAYAGLLLLTALAFWLTVGHGAAGLGEAQSVIWSEVILLAYIKVRWILLDFMELRSAPIRLRLLFEFFAVTLAAGLIAISLSVG